MSETAPFIIVPVSVLEDGLSPQAFMLYAAIRKHARRVDGGPLQTYVGRERLAEYLGMKKVASVDRYTQELVTKGLITSQVRWCSKRDKRDWVLEKDSEHTMQGSNLYTFLAGQTGSLSGDPLGPFLGTPGVPQKGHELDPFNQIPLTDEKTSVSASAAPEDLPVDGSKLGERTEDPLPLHAEWTPNNANRKVAAEVGVDADHMAEVFRAAALNSDERRRCWGAVFSDWLRAEADSRGHGFGFVDADAVATAAVDAAVASLAAVEPVIDAEIVEPEPVVEPEAPAFVADSPAAASEPTPVVVDRVSVNLKRLDRLMIVRPLRRSERVEAEKLLRAGHRVEEVRAQIDEGRKASRLMATAELHRQAS